MQELDGGKKKNQVREDRDFGICALASFKKFDLQVRREDAPIKVKDRKRNQNDNQRCALGELPPRSFQLPRDEHDERKRPGQSHADSTRNEERQRRGGNHRVGSEAEVGVE